MVCFFFACCCSLLWLVVRGCSSLVAVNLALFVVGVGRLVSFFVVCGCLLFVVVVSFMFVILFVSVVVVCCSSV